MRNGTDIGRYSGPYKGHITKSDSDSDSDLGTYVPRYVTSGLWSIVPIPNPKSLGNPSRATATIGIGGAAA